MHRHPQRSSADSYSIAPPARRGRGQRVIVIAYELGGRFGGEALKFFDDIARSSTITSTAANKFKTYWLRRMATVAQKAHGRLLRTRLPSLASFRVPGMRAAPAPLAHILDFPNPATISGSGSRVHFDDTSRVMGSGTD